MTPQQSAPCEHLFAAAPDRHCLLGCGAVLPDSVSDEDEEDPR